MSEGEVSETEEHFDYVMVCNGHLNTPNMPDFEGMSEFKGVQYHMHELRDFTPEEFEGKNVLVVGAFVSANDLIVNIFHPQKGVEKVTPAKVVLTSRDTSAVEKSDDYLPYIRDGKLTIRGGNVAVIKENSVVFGDGSEEQIDTIIYATGYKYSMPFFKKDDEIVTFEGDLDRGLYFGPLFKRMFSINQPNIFFIGLTEKAPLLQPTYERQVMLAKEVITGKIRLPEKAKMLEDLESQLKHYADNGLDKTKYFKMFDDVYSFWDYLKELEDLTSMEVDKVSLYSLKPALDARCALYSTGNSIRTKNFDYGPFLDEVDYKPTSDKF